MSSRRMEHEMHPSKSTMPVTAKQPEDAEPARGKHVRVVTKVADRVGDAAAIRDIAVNAKRLNDYRRAVKAANGLKIAKPPLLKGGIMADVALGAVASAVEQGADLLDFKEKNDYTWGDVARGAGDVFTTGAGLRNFGRGFAGSLMDVAAFVDPFGVIPNGDKIRDTMEDAKGGNVRADEAGGDVAPDADPAVSDKPPVEEREPSPEPSAPARIIINPKVFKDKRDGLCVAYNEAFRVIMEMNGFDPQAEPTEEQRKFFSDTAYADDERMLRRTILARVCTFDDSVKNPTDEQLDEALEFLETVMEIGAPQSEEEQANVQRIHDMIAEIRKAPRLEDEDEEEENEFLPRADAKGGRAVRADSFGGDAMTDPDEDWLVRRAKQRNLENTGWSIIAGSAITLSKLYSGAVEVGKITNDAWDAANLAGGMIEGVAGGERATHVAQGIYDAGRAVAGTAANTAIKKAAGAGLAGAVATASVESAVRQGAQFVDYLKETDATSDEVLRGVKDVFTTKQGWHDLGVGFVGALKDVANTLTFGAVENGDSFRENHMGGPVGAKPNPEFSPITGLNEPAEDAAKIRADAEKSINENRKANETAASTRASEENEYYESRAKWYEEQADKNASDPETAARYRAQAEEMRGRIRSDVKGGRVKRPVRGDEKGGRAGAPRGSAKTDDTYVTNTAVVMPEAEARKMGVVTQGFEHVGKDQVAIPFEDFRSNGTVVDAAELLAESYGSKEAAEAAVAKSMANRAKRYPGGVPSEAAMADPESVPVVPAGARPGPWDEAYLSYAARAGHGNLKTIKAGPFVHTAGYVPGLSLGFIPTRVFGTSSPSIEVRRMLNSQIGETAESVGNGRVVSISDAANPNKPGWYTADEGYRAAALGSIKGWLTANERMPGENDDLAAVMAAAYRDRAGLKLGKIDKNGKDFLASVAKAYDAERKGTAGRKDKEILKAARNADMWEQVVGARRYDRYSTTA